MQKNRLEVASKNLPKILAFHLPQFHPIEENSNWWGPGFTEWHNVARARPLYRGHKQPKLPGELGFYDLRLTETQERQADLAQSYGIHGFCYWHYWFGGRRLLEKPLENLLAAPHIDFPFCLGWANESWTGVWHGQPKKTLVEQTYPSDDASSHYATLRRFFLDPRYVKHDNRPVLYIYRPNGLKNSLAYYEKLRSLARSDGFPDLYILGTWSPNPSGRFDQIESMGLDGAVIMNITGRDSQHKNSHYIDAISARIKGKISGLTGPQRIPYIDAAKEMLPDLSQFNFPAYHTVISNWDNTPRSGRRGLVLTGCSPEKFKDVLKAAIEKSDFVNQDGKPRFIFLKSWNEWAEGNFVEPSFDEERQYLEAISQAMKERY
ncbi:MAG: lipopolysaccharide biosynthesis protein [Sphingorhabdus sp.]|uniref:glycosyltransferase WbsX family protein n=1 Tax=Sphingorhabdus sp. TaxID=1902408 RepID=UPI0025E97623|nr:glycoside hydrolase family 99-like domain-containing protein [Sphingorhabdus sp.]MCO4090761.1 lipopolysaccharide biosynthesis protein [Sphingorhabdus sp.]